MGRVFISYATEDNGILAAPLEARGLNVWYDNFKPEVGEAAASTTA